MNGLQSLTGVSVTQRQLTTSESPPQQEWLQKPYLRNSCTACRQLYRRVPSPSNCLLLVKPCRALGSLWFSELSGFIHGVSFCPYSWRECLNTQNWTQTLNTAVASWKVYLFTRLVSVLPGVSMQSGFLKLQSTTGEMKKSWASMTMMSSGRSQVWPSVYFLYIKWNLFLVATVEKTPLRTCLSVWGKLTNSLIQSPVQPAVRYNRKMQCWTNRARRLLSAVRFSKLCQIFFEFSKFSPGFLCQMCLLSVFFRCQMPSHTWILEKQYIVLKICISQRLLIWYANELGILHSHWIQLPILSVVTLTPLDLQEKLQAKLLC